MEWYWIVAIVLGSLVVGYYLLAYLLLLGFIEMWKEFFNR